MKIESITWHETPLDGLPDPESTVLISTEADGVDSGFFDGKDWRWCESGGIVAEPVQAWAEMPVGLTPLLGSSGDAGSFPMSAQLASLPEEVADLICREVAELPDRNSPPDWPEAMLVTADELRSIAVSVLVAKSLRWASVPFS